jgi:hypothetical protein
MDMYFGPIKLLESLKRASQSMFFSPEMVIDEMCCDPGQVFVFGDL